MKLAGRQVEQASGAVADAVRDALKGAAMPGLNCTCGHRIDYGQIPCPDEWLIISDVAYDGFTGMVDAEDVYRAMKGMLKCPACARLWVFWDGYQNPPQEFVPAPKRDELE